MDNERKTIDDKFLSLITKRNKKLLIKVVNRLKELNMIESYQIASSSRGFLRGNIHTLSISKPKVDLYQLEDFAKRMYEFLGGK